MHYYRLAAATVVDGICIYSEHSRRLPHNERVLWQNEFNAENNGGVRVWEIWTGIILKSRQTGKPGRPYMCCIRTSNVRRFEYDCFSKARTPLGTPLTKIVYPMYTGLWRVQNDPGRQQETRARKRRESGRPVVAIQRKTPFVPYAQPFFVDVL